MEIPFSLTSATLTPTLSQRERGQRKLPLPPGEGWGWSRAFERHAASLQNDPGLQARVRTASEGPHAPWAT